MNSDNKKTVFSVHMVNGSRVALQSFGEAPAASKLLSAWFTLPAAAGSYFPSTAFQTGVSISFPAGIPVLPSCISACSVPAQAVLHFW